MIWNDGLTGVTLEIAGSTANRLVVMAGPGSGKTFALKRKILKLIEEGTEPAKILTLTFTRTIADDLKKELNDLGIENVTSMKAMTLHAFCFSLLNQKRVFDILRRVPRPIKYFNSKGSPQFELSPLLADLDLLDDFGSKREKFSKIKAFEAAWARRQQDIPNDISASDIKFKNALLNWLKMHKALLLGELVPLTLEYLQNNPSDNVFADFSHIIVDEYQDLNKSEQILIDLVGRNCKINIVGDVDQSIYSFRFANPDGIIDFANRHEECEQFTIESCRRCGKSIVHAANALIMNNHNEFSDRLCALPENKDGKVRSIQWQTVDDEAIGITNFIKSLIDNGYSLSDILILSPRRLLAYKIKEKLQVEGLNTHSFFHEEAIESVSAQKSVALLNLMISPDDCVALRFWLGLGSKNWRAPQYKLLKDTAESSSITIRQLLDRLLSNQIDIKNVSNIKKSYQELLDSVEALKGKSVAEMVNQLFPEGNDDTKILREACLLLLEENRNILIEDVWSYIERLITQPETPENGNYIRIMSLHKSKGLTSRVTIIVNCIEGLIPRREKDNSQKSQDLLQEQRRLFYVAMTRAKEYLVISSFLKIDTNLAHAIGAEIGNTRKKTASTQASQFITETKLATITGKEWCENAFS